MKNYGKIRPDKREKSWMSLEAVINKLIHMLVPQVKEVSLVREQTQDSFDGFEELYKRLFIN